MTVEFKSHIAKVATGAALSRAPRAPLAAPALWIRLEQPRVERGRNRRRPPTGCLFAHTSFTALSTCWDHRLVQDSVDPEASRRIEPGVLMVAGHDECGSLALHSTTLALATLGSAVAKDAGPRGPDRRAGRG